MPSTKVGALRHRVTIQEKQTGDATATGGAPVTWVDLWDDVPASIRHLYGKEIDLARQHSARATHKITIRYHKNVTPECRVVFGSQIFNIGDANDIDERHLWIELVATEEK